MKSLATIRGHWKPGIERLGKLVPQINKRTPIQGDWVLFDESASGIRISADIGRIQALIDAAVSAIG